MKSAHFHSNIGQGLNDMASCPPIHMMRVSKVFLSFSSFFLLFCFIGEFYYPGRSRDTCDIIGRANHDTTGNDIGVTECFTHWENEKIFQRLTSYWQLGCNI